MSNEERKQPASSGGMGKSAPLVTIPAAPPASLANNPATTSTTTSVGASDHPLAAAATTAPPPLPPPAGTSHRQEPSAPINPSHTPSSTGAAGSNATPVSINATRTVAAKALTMNPTSLGFQSPAPPPIGQQKVAIPKALMSTPPSQQHLSTVDEMADAFLRGNENDPKASAGPTLLRPLPLPETKSDFERVRVLVERRAWGDVLSMTTSLLKGPQSHYATIYALFCNPNHSKSASTNLLQPELLQEFFELLLLQLLAWITMRRYTEVRKEVDAWVYCRFNRTNNNNNKTLNSNPSISTSSQASTVQTSNQSSSSGSPQQQQQSQSDASWIPWKVHIMAAASLQYTSKDKSAAPTALWRIRNELEQQMPGTALDMIHVDHTLSNIFATQGEWRMALDSLERLSALLPEGVAALLKNNNNTETPEKEPDPALVKVLVDACQCELWSRQGRILLQLGALEGAHALMEQAVSLWQNVPYQEHAETHNEQVRRILQGTEPQIQANLGLLQFAYQKYNLALEHFRKSLQLMESNMAQKEAAGGNGGVCQYQYLVTDWIGGGLLCPVAHHTLFSEVTSNLAVTALYTCRLQEAIHVMERLIQRDPAQALTERSALNLCTLYELSGDAASATRKKKTLQLIAKRFFLHDIGPESFRL